jgi:protein involved in polysaccharide export with SLBB domain
MGGGVTAAGDTSKIQVERFEGNSSRVILDFSLDSRKLSEPLSRVEVLDRDMVKVFSVQRVLKNVVSLQGNVVKPGEYQFRKGMKLTDVIPSIDLLLPETFLDSLQITRLVPPDNRQEVVSADLGKALRGDPQENIELKEQDIIRVYSREQVEEKRQVHIYGEVTSPGDMKYYPNMTVRDLVVHAGSLKSTALLDNAELTRIVMEDGKARSTRQLVDLRKAMAGDPAQNIVLQAHDSLIVRRVQDWLDATDRFVTVGGEVKYPGTYSITKGERLSSLLERAGGYTEEAYLLGAKFLRRSVQEDQQRRMEEVIARTEQDITQKQGELASLSSSKEELEATKTALQGLLQNLQKLKGLKAEGRVVIRLASVESLKTTPYDLELRGGDKLEIPATPSVVNVFGQVYSPSTLVYLPNRNVEYYLEMAGGPTRQAEKGDMYIIKADGSVQSRQQSSFGISWSDASKSWTFGSFFAAPLNPGDTLVVPQQIERTAWMREIKDITTIISQLAISAGVAIAAINR